MQQFMNLVKDKNLELDPYFYERKRELHQIRTDIKSSKVEMLSEEQYKKEIEEFFSKTIKI